MGNIARGLYFWMQSQWLSMSFLQISLNRSSTPIAKYTPKALHSEGRKALRQILSEEATPLEMQQTKEPNSSENKHKSATFCKDFLWRTQLAEGVVQAQHKK